jgi:hypothetical protein
MFPVSPVRDTFNRPDEHLDSSVWTRITTIPISWDSLSGQWDNIAASYPTWDSFDPTYLRVLSNEVTATSTTTSVQYVFNESMHSADHEAYCTLAAISNNPGDTVDVIVRYNGVNWYFARLAVGAGPTYTIQLLWDSGNVTAAAPILTPVPGQVFGARISGEIFEAYLGSNRIAFALTNQIAVGTQIGTGMANSNWRIDNFGGGQYFGEEPSVGLTLNYEIRAS